MIEVRPEPELDRRIEAVGARASIVDAVRRDVDGIRELAARSKADLEAMDELSAAAIGATIGVPIRTLIRLPYGLLYGVTQEALVRLLDRRVRFGGGWLRELKSAAASALGAITAAVVGVIANAQGEVVGRPCRLGLEVTAEVRERGRPVAHHLETGEHRGGGRAGRDPAIAPPRIKAPAFGVRVGSSTVMVVLPTSAFVGVPLKVRVAALNVSQLGTPAAL